MPQYVDSKNRVVAPHSRYAATTQMVQKIVHLIEVDTETGKPVLEDGKPVIVSTEFDHAKIVPARETTWEQIIQRDKLKSVPSPQDVAETKRVDAKRAHQERLEKGVEWDGTYYPCTEKDQRGLAKLLVAHQNHEQMYQQWVADNPIHEAESEENYAKRMLKDNVTDPSKLKYTMVWSNGATLEIYLKDIRKIFATMTLLVDDSFKQRDAATSD